MPQISRYSPRLQKQRDGVRTLARFSSELPPGYYLITFDWDLSLAFINMKGVPFEVTRDFIRVAQQDRCYRAILHVQKAVGKKVIHVLIVGGHNEVFAMNVRSRPKELTASWRKQNPSIVSDLRELSQW